ncbi:MAG: halocyanin domain-containing protein [Haloferacaceae archaeon]
MNRRDFLKTAGGTAATVTAAAGGAAAQEGGGGSEKPQFGSWLQGVDGGYKDLRGNGEVTVQVGADGNGGAYAFAPAGIWVDEGTTVKWEWTGEGGAHNVVGNSGPASDMNSGSPTAEQGVHFEHTFESGGITEYYCNPHQGLGMKGAVAVGDGVPTQQTGGGGKEQLHELGVPLQAHYVGGATILGVLSTLVFTFYVLKYGESPNTGNTGGGED